MAADHEESQRWQDLIAFASSIIAPVTVVTALLVYAAWARTKTFYNFFGVDPSVLNLSIQEYLLRSADTAFGLLGWICLSGLTLLAATRFAGRLYRLLDERRRMRLRAAAPWIGTACILLGLLSGVWTQFPLKTPYGATTLLISGALLLHRSRNLIGFRRGTINDYLLRVTLIVAVALGGFWSATIYARALGTREAGIVDANPESLPEVDLYSAKPLDIPGSLIASSDVSVTPSERSYRYVGLRLLEFANDRWVVITGRREGLHCSVLIIRDTDELRVQIASSAT